MKTTRLSVPILLIQAVMLFSVNSPAADMPGPIALTGRVSSSEEGPMEGVLVSAKREGSKLTVTIISDAQGRYAFPKNRLEAGRYHLRTRATGYDLADPGLVEITAQKTTSLDLKLLPTKDLASQLTNAEWVVSVPGTPAQKEMLQCAIGCHTIERTVRSRHNAAEWKTAIPRMNTYHPGGSQDEFQILPERELVAARAKADSKSLDDMAAYFSSINLSSASQWQYPLKTFPRPKGKSTRIIITEYDLPRKATAPHDVTVDSEGTVWYCDFRNSYMGHLDPKTAKIVEYRVPVIKADLPRGCRSVQFDPDGNIWVSMNDQGAAARFDRKTEQFQVWPVPGGDGTNPRVTSVQARHLDVDGKVWAQAPRGVPNHATGSAEEYSHKKSVQWRIQRLDVRAGKWEEPINVDHILTDVFADSQNNVYFTDHDSEVLGKVDAKTLQVKTYRTPTLNSGPERGHFDSQGRFWFGEDRANRFAVFDPKTERFQEWVIPTPSSNVWDVVLDKNGDAWAGGMMSDRVSRLNSATGEIIMYQLPRPTNIRKVEVDNSPNRPVSFWAGNKIDSAIIRIEPLE